MGLITLFWLPLSICLHLFSFHGYSFLHPERMCMKHTILFRSVGELPLASRASDITSNVHSDFLS